MRRCLHGILLLAVLALPALAAAQPPKLAIGAIRGDASSVRRQLLLELCGPYQCVAASRVTTGDRADPNKLAQAGVSGYLSGSVTGEPGERKALLSLTTPDQPVRTWKFKLTTDGKLRPAAVERFTAEVGAALSAAATRPAPAPAQPPTRPPAAPLPPPRASAAEAPPPRAPPPADATAKPLPASAALPPGTGAPQPHALRFALDAGIWVTRRHLTYSGAVASTPPLRTFDASAILVPEVRAEVYPLAFGDAGRLWSGIGAYAQYGRSVGLRVKPPSGVSGGERSASLTDLAAGLRWRLEPIATSRFSVTPALAYRRLTLITGGGGIDGLPDSRLSGFEGRLDLAVPVTARVTVLGGGGYQYWTSAKDLVKGYFAGGDARGFEAEAGVDVKLLKPLSVRALAEYENVSYTLRKGSTGAFTANGARDAYLGGRIAARAEF